MYSVRRLAPNAMFKNAHVAIQLCFGMLTKSHYDESCRIHFLRTIWRGELEIDCDTMYHTHSETQTPSGQ